MTDKPELYYVWCKEHGTDDDAFSIAACKTHKEADATRGMAAALQPNCTFFITKGA